MNFAVTLTGVGEPRQLMVVGRKGAAKLLDAFVPARRAAAVDPMVAMRVE